MPLRHSPRRLFPNCPHAWLQCRASIGTPSRSLLVVLNLIKNKPIFHLTQEQPKSKHIHFTLCMPESHKQLEGESKQQLSAVMVISLVFGGHHSWEVPRLYHSIKSVTAILEIHNYVDRERDGALAILYFSLVQQISSNFFKSSSGA